jgi:hypothetical protein
MHHDLDSDATCIHCGLDTCDVPKGERVPPCPVYDEIKRAQAFQSWLELTEPTWDDTYD